MTTSDPPNPVVRRTNNSRCLVDALVYERTGGEKLSNMVGSRSSSFVRFQLQSFKLLDPRDSGPARRRFRSAKAVPHLFHLVPNWARPLRMLLKPRYQAVVNQGHPQHAHILCEPLSEKPDPSAQK